MSFFLALPKPCGGSAHPCMQQRSPCMYVCFTHPFVTPLSPLVAQQGIQPSSVRLLYQGHLLEDIGLAEANTLSARGIRNGTTVHMVERMVSGFWLCLVRALVAREW